MKNATTREGAGGDKPLALIAAGGEGRRLGSSGPKALVFCAGRPLLAWCLDAFAQSRTFGDGAGLVVVAAHASDLPAFESAADEARATGLHVLVTEGGPSRSHSVAAALRAGQAEAADEAGTVLVHDAARIFTTPELIDALHDGLAAGSVDALIAAAPVTDTIKRADADQIVRETPPRDQLWAVQTPQAFRIEALSSALDADDAILANATDDASLIEAGGGKVKLFNWSTPNPKITTSEDLAAAEGQLRRSGR
ncbi:MAG: 2-C-methyl-D-erythritol 4-phosphate cytidylyltransferase [Thermoleophilaceae bacterium]|nr:2-C-methyl-D-erythritol 4-phosphate cytidylyltransferase [Thermoleophilaceae bacterium]